MEPRVFIASHVYAPESSTRASVIVRLPRPALLLVSTRGPVGIFPQFNLQTISGVGVPTASQIMVKLPPNSTSIFDTGGKLMTGGAKNKLYKQILTLLEKNILHLSIFS